MTDYRELGRAAFEAGLPCAPILNPEVQAALVDRPVGIKDTQRILRAYTAGWNAANLAAPLPEEEEEELAAELAAERAAEGAVHTAVEHYYEEGGSWPLPLKGKGEKA